MVYNNAIPQPTDKLKNSQADLLNNFASVSTLVNINHVDFDDPSGDQGKHKHVTFPEQAASPTTAVNEAAIYAKQGSGGATQLFYKPENQAPGATEFEFTYALKALAGYTYLPSGLLMKWGRNIANGVTDVTIATAPQFNNIYNLSITPITNTAADSNRDVVLLTLVVNAGADFVMKVDSIRRLDVAAVACSFYWVAIGD